VGNVELQSQLAWLSPESWFPLWTAVKGEGGGRYIEVATENDPQNAATGNKAIAILWEAIPFSPLLLVWGQDSFQLLENCCRPIQTGLPNINLL
jgi:hypothetical protein